MSENIQDLLDFANQVAWNAGKITLQYFQTDMAIELKLDDSPVTSADKETELYMRDVINSTYPAHGILGEEYEEKPGSSSYRWVIDPIDGTKTFVRGAPFYSCTLGLERDGIPIIGVINFPALKESVYAGEALGCWWNGRRCRVSQVTSLNESLVLASLAKGYRPEDQLLAYEALLAASGMFRTWGDSYGYTLVATGRAEIMFDPWIKHWDAAPLLPILQEAGGTYTDWEGNATIHGESGLATNGYLFEEVLNLIRLQKGSP